MTREQIARLHNGDEVRVEIDGCSRILKIASIKHLEDHAYLIITVDGERVEVFEDEIG